MPFKPMKKRDYLKWIGKYGWTLKKGSVDWKLVDSQGKVRKPNIIVTHNGEVIPKHVGDTKKLLQMEGLE